ncbi:SDR family NAD(P)-dependent oxidoreductase [Blastococcus sp. URHD0036]|uniref:SDR family NAD(P)-dependent oxidoreductase n=1 Tax=Blastococcus sp. URHD0036 TaxID=1380356 RepID=UPI00068ECA8A|nr:SDR family NAD(P)-dependent oxidoreductase [Blastococcus sp. URHD0036]
MSIRFDGQVAIVTGAGRGMGRDIAQLLARRGASVVVNDYGGAASTLEPGSADIARSVADGIVAEGGTAVADATTVGTGEAARAIVDRALEAFGRIDVLVNNAGGSILGELDAFEDEQVEGVLRTNLIGPYMLMRRVWPHMRAQGYGRIVNVMSGAMLGMGHNAPYAAGKAGLIGLDADAALTGAAHGIGVNGLCPVAYSRLAKGGPPEVADRLKRLYPPRLAAEAVVYLCSRENEATGEIFSAGGGRVARYAMVRNAGVFDAELTADRLAGSIAAVRDLTGATVPARAAGLPDPAAG